MQANNSYYLEKLNLRKSILSQNKKYKILDCFAGESELWNNIKKNYDIKITSIDKNNIDVDYYGDNIKILPTLDLDKYDIIDLDAYGIPFKQLEIIFNKKYKGIIIFTFIQSFSGVVNKKMLYYLGYTKEMLKKIPTLFYRNGFEKFCNYLSKKGVDRIYYICKNKKYYGYINLS